MSSNQGRKNRFGWRVWYAAGMALLALAAAGVFLWFWHSWRRSALPIESPRVQLGLIQQQDPELMWVLQPNLSNVQLEYSPKYAAPVTTSVSTNALGLRNGPIGPKADRFRIVAVGDSTTFGLGVAAADAWPSRLQSLLDPDARLVEVINAGVSGYSAFQCLRYLQLHAERLEPDLIVATTGNNDVSIWSDTSDMEAAARLAAPDALEQFQRAREQAFPYRLRPEKRPRLTPGEYVDTLIEMRRFCDEQGWGLVLVKWPQLPKLTGQGEAFLDYYGFLDEAGKTTRTPIADPADALRAMADAVYTDDIHVNAVGYEIVARTVAEYVKEDLKGQNGDDWAFHWTTWAHERLDDGVVSGIADVCNLLIALRGHAPAYLALGRLAEMEGELDRAIRAYQSGAEANPGDNAMAEALSRALAARGATGDR